MARPGFVRPAPVPERALGILLCLTWALLWPLPWQAALEASPWARAAIAAALLLLPGLALQQLLLPSPERPSLAAGFVISTGITGMLGLVACLARLAPATLANGVCVLGAALLLAVAARAPLPLPDHETFAGLGRRLAIVAPLLLAAALAARLALAPEVGGDDHTHAARIRFFLSTEHLGFQDFLFGQDRPAPPRYWLSFWPLCLAAFSRLSGLSPLEALGVYVGPLVALIAVLAAFELLRALRFSTPVAALGSAAQVICLLFATAQDQAGGPFFNRISEDKAIVPFVAAPVFFRLVAMALREPTPARITLLAFGGVGMLLTHPVMGAVACGIAALWAALDYAVERRLRAALAVLAVALALPLAPAPLRFFSPPRHSRFTVEELRESSELNPRRERRMDILEGSRYFGIDPHVFGAWPFALPALAGVVALVRRGRGASARFLLAAVALLVAAAIPQTAWLLGMAITPPLVFRVFWFTPFGTSLAFLVAAAADRWGAAEGLAAALSRPAVVAGEVAAFSGLAALALAGPARGELQSWPLPSGWADRAFTMGRQGLAATCGDTGQERMYADLGRIGALLDGAIQGRAVVAGDRDTNEFIPALTAKATLVAFRVEAHTSLQGGFSMDATHQRFLDLAALVSAEARTAERRQVLDARGVDFLLLCGEPAWTADLASLRKLGEAGPLRLYAVRHGRRPRARLAAPSSQEERP